MLDHVVPINSGLSYKLIIFRYLAKCLDSLICWLWQEEARVEVVSHSKVALLKNAHVATIVKS
jgi:hypothetical protein